MPAAAAALAVVMESDAEPELTQTVPERPKYFFPAQHTPLLQTRTRLQLQAQNQAMAHEPLLQRISTANPLQLTMVLAELLFNYRVSMSKTHGGPFDNLSRMTSLTSPEGAVLPLHERRSLADPYAQGCRSLECGLGKLCDSCWTAYTVCKIGDALAGIDPSKTILLNSPAADFRQSLRPLVANLFRITPGSYEETPMRYPAAEAAAAARADIKNGVDTRMTNRYTERSEQDVKAATELKLNGTAVKLFPDSPLQADAVADLYARCGFLEHLTSSPLALLTGIRSSLPLVKSMFQMAYDMELAITKPYHGSKPGLPFIGVERCKLLPDAISESDAIALAEARGHLDPKNVNRCYYCSVVYTFTMMAKPMLAEHEIPDARAFCVKLFHPSLTQVMRVVATRHITHASVTAAAAAAAAANEVGGGAAPASAAAAVTPTESSSAGIKRKRGRPKGTFKKAAVGAAAAAAAAASSVAVAVAAAASSATTPSHPAKRHKASPVIINASVLALMKGVIAHYQQKEEEERAAYAKLNAATADDRRSFWLASARDTAEALAAEKTAASESETSFIHETGIRFLDLYTGCGALPLLTGAKLDATLPATKALVERVRVRLGRRWLLRPVFVNLEKVFESNKNVKQIVANAIASLSEANHMQLRRMLEETATMNGVIKTKHSALTRLLSEATCAHAFFRALVARGVPADAAYDDLALLASKTAKTTPASRIRGKVLERIGRTVFECPAFLFVDMGPYTADGLKGFKRAYQIETEGCGDLPIDHLRSLKATRRGMYDTLWGDDCPVMTAYRAIADVDRPLTAAPAPAAAAAADVAAASSLMVLADQKVLEAAAFAAGVAPAPAAAAAAAAATDIQPQPQSLALQQAHAYYGGLPGSNDC